MNPYTEALTAHDHIDAYGHKTVEARCVICSTKPAPRADSIKEPAATERQVEFLKSLVSQVDELADKLGLGRFAQIDYTVLTKRQASRGIDALKELQAQYRQQVAKLPKPEVKEIEAGFYVIDQQVYKVQRAVHGNGRMYAKILRVGEDGRGRFEYDPAATQGVISQIDPAKHTLSRESAKELGPVYGVCIRCGAPLTEDDSIERMMGPVCYRKTGF